MWGRDLGLVIYNIPGDLRDENIQRGQKRQIGCMSDNKFLYTSLLEGQNIIRVKVLYTLLIETDT